MRKICQALKMKNTIDKVNLPNGQQEKLDKLEKLYLIAKEVQKKEEVQFAIFGKPSAPVYQPILDAQLEYWKELDNSKPVDYGELQGEEAYRIRMAAALSKQYGVEVGKDDVVFTSGGRIAIQAFSYLFNLKCADNYLVTTNLYYPDHTGISYASDKQHQLLLIDVESAMSAVTEDLLIETLDGIDKDRIGAFVFCDPNNPMGNIIGKEEWLKIIPILEQYENAIILLDEAYAEMVFDQAHESLFSLATEKLRKRIILMRSATKGFSVSGERMAVLVSSNKEYINKIIEYHAANLVHSPKSSQNAYTRAMEVFNVEEQLKLASFYHPIVREVESVLSETQFNIQHPNYQERQATFYVMADMSELFGLEITEEMKKYYSSPNKKYVSNNIDIAMYILFKYKLAIMPMYFFGAKLNSGLIRITCSFEEKEEIEKLKDTFRAIRKDLSDMAAEKEVKLAEPVLA